MNKITIEQQRAEFEAALSKRKEAMYWNTSDAMFWAWQAARKCDGNHGGPRCADPGCWNDSPQPAEPVKVPSDKLINDLAREAYSYAVDLDAATRNADPDEIEGVAKTVTTQLKEKLRALLASYDQPAHSAVSADPIPVNPTDYVDIQPAANAAPSRPTVTIGEDDNGEEAGKEHSLGFNAGICVALQILTSHDAATIWREIVQATGIHELLHYAANVEPDEWELAGFKQYARPELNKRKPAKRTAAPTRSAIRISIANRGGERTVSWVRQDGTDTPSLNPQAKQEAK